MYSQRWVWRRFLALFPIQNQWKCCSNHMLKRSYSSNLSIPADNIVGIDQKELLDALYSRISDSKLKEKSPLISKEMDQIFLHSVKADYIDQAQKAREKRTDLLNQISNRKEEEFMSILHINQVIELNALAGRAKEAQAAFDMLAKVNICPDVNSYNYLMEAYLCAKEHGRVLELFDEMKQSTQTIPNEQTYLLVTRSLVDGGNLREAFDMESSWRGQGKKLPAGVYASLMRGCLIMGDLRRVETVFDFLRSQVHQPDASCFELMIEACGERGEAEKALDLFAQMADYGIPYTRESFHSVLGAMANRKDYYPQIHVKLNMMLEHGFELDAKLYRILIGGASKYGDIQQGRKYWNEMMRQFLTGDDSYRPCLMDAGNMISLCATYMERPSSYSKEHITEKQQEAAADPSSLIENTCYSFEDGSRGLYLNDRYSNNLVALQGAAVYEYALKTLWSYEENDTGRKNLLNRYLAFLSNSPRAEHRAQTLSFFREEFKRMNVDCDGVSYSILLWYLADRRNLNIAETESIWNEFLSWDKEREDLFDGKDENREKWRKSEGRGKDETIKKFKYLIRNYTRAGDFEKAIDFLAASKVFRYPGYLRNLNLRDITELLDVAAAKAEDGHLHLLSKIKELCPREASPWDVIQKKLERKSLSRNWWGWDAMGVGKRRRNQYLRTK